MPTLLAERYELGEELGRGGFSIVYAARDKKLDQPVAVKLLVPPPAQAEVALERLRREVRVVRTLAHPNILTVFDLIEEPGRAFIVMERVVGQDLATRVAQRGPLPPEEAISIATQIADALTVAHQHLILHRDVKPSNILLGDDGRARLVDFGSARVDGETSLTRSGGFVGTLDYAAPELIAGRRADPRADLYGLGMVIFFALTGALPKRGLVHLPPEASPEGHHPVSLVPSTPAWLDRWVARATSADPAQRHPTAEAMKRALLERQSEPKSTAIARAGSFCLRCGADGAGETSLCGKCAASIERGPLFLLVSARRGQMRPEAISERLRQVLGSSVDQRGLGEVARGRKALVQLAEGDLAGIGERMKALGVPVRTIPINAPYWAIPPSFFGLLILIVAVGGIAGAVWPVHRILAPLVAITLYALARTQVTRPLVGVSNRGVLAPSSDSTPSHPLVRDVESLARGALTSLRQSGAPLELQQSVESLAAAARQAGRGLLRLEHNLELLERQARSAGANTPESLRSTIEQTEQARNALVQRLLESLAALGAAEGAGAQEELGAANAALINELSLRHEAIREIDGLLGGGAPG